jgi:GNAT superfamily N-acetyltransferase
MHPTDLLVLADRNFAESLREKARWCAAAEAWEHDGLLCVSSATRLPAGPFNAAFPTGPAGGDAELVERARAWFEDRGRGFSLYLRGPRDAALLESARASHLHLVEETPVMAIEAAPPAPPAVAGARVELVSDDAGRAAFVDVSAAAWEPSGLQPAALRKHFANPSRVAGPQLAIVLARAAADDTPLATAVALLSDNIAGLYWVGTRPDARGRGLGAAVTAAATRWAFDAGARAVVLQASRHGEPVYRRLGYHEIARYPWLVARHLR